MILATQDKAAVAQANGVGPKLAARIVSELKDKAAKMPTGSSVSIGSVAPVAEALPQSVSQDAVSALENLGYGRSEAFTAVAAAQIDVGEDAEVSKLIGAALKALAT